MPEKTIYVFSISGASEKFRGVVAATAKQIWPLVAEERVELLQVAHKLRYPVVDWDFYWSIREEKNLLRVTIDERHTPKYWGRRTEIIGLVREVVLASGWAIVSEWEDEPPRGRTLVASAW